MRKSLFLIAILMIYFLLYPFDIYPQEDRVVRAAIETFKANVRLPQGAQIKFIEKKESPISDFFSVKIIILIPGKEIPSIVYVDKTGEKVLIGNLFIKGENITKKDAGPARSKKIDIEMLDIEKSPSMGDKKAKVVIVEFSNFQCPYCMDSWLKFKELIERYPRDFKYIFKHFPFQTKGRTFELSELASAAQEISNEAFWIVHDFFFTKEGQEIVNLEMGIVKRRVEQMLREKGHDVQIFNSALETGKAKKRVLEDMNLANILRLTSTPTKIVNGDIIVGSTSNQVLEKYLEK